MKNAFHIKRDFPGMQTRTFGRDNFFTCEVQTPDGAEFVKGIGTTLEKAEDTAWYAVKIQLRETPATVRVDPFKSGPIPDWANTSAGIRAHGIKDDGDLINPYR